tara:strand:+ start:1107 stop:1226 length:120 start_codon:yes stop_codon:yes gene_type:complete
MIDTIPYKYSSYILDMKVDRKKKKKKKKKKNITKRKRKK